MMRLHLMFMTLLLVLVLLLVLHGDHAPPRDKETRPSDEKWQDLWGSMACLASGATTYATITYLLPKACRPVVVMQRKGLQGGE